jgi:hypothetical protein
VRNPYQSTLLQPQRTDQQAVSGTIIDFCFNGECLGTPIPDLQSEFDSLQAKHNHTVALLQAMEARLTRLETDSPSGLGSSWWHLGALVLVAIIVIPSVLIAGVLCGRRLWPSTDESSPLLWR